jgi:hypothetical protein
MISSHAALFNRSKPQLLWYHLSKVGVGAISPIRGALTSLASPSPCGLRRTLCASGKSIRHPCCSREFPAPGTSGILIVPRGIDLSA